MTDSKTARQTRRALRGVGCDCRVRVGEGCACVSGVCARLFSWQNGGLRVQSATNELALAHARGPQTHERGVFFMAAPPRPRGVHWDKRGGQAACGKRGPPPQPLVPQAPRSMGLFPRGMAPPFSRVFI